MTLDDRAKEIWLLAPQTPFSAEEWAELPDNNETKIFIFKLARYVEREVLKAIIHEYEEQFLKADTRTDQSEILKEYVRERIADLTRQLDGIGEPSHENQT